MIAGRNLPDAGGDAFAQLCATYRGTSSALHALALAEQLRAAAVRYSRRPGSNPILAARILERIELRRETLREQLRELRRRGLAQLAECAADRRRAPSREVHR